MTFGNIAEKRENAGNQYFYPFLKMFSTLSKKEIIISATVNLSSADFFQIGQGEMFCTGLRLYLFIDHFANNLVFQKPR